MEEENKKNKSWYILSFYYRDLHAMRTEERIWPFIGAKNKLVYQQVLLQISGQSSVSKNMWSSAKIINSENGFVDKKNN